MKKRTFSPSVSSLESRILLYAVSGDAWPFPSHVTISFMPDGTDLGGQTSDMEATMAANTHGLSGGVWKTEILRGAQQWAINAGVSLSLVSDDGADWGEGDYQQGDPGHGDIRIGGYGSGTAFGSHLAYAILPPPDNNFDLAGDIMFNTDYSWANGGAYDLQTVAIHEIGHALGLDHSAAGSTSVMWPVYTSTKNSLTADDIAGIDAIYSYRSQDEYDALGSGNTLGTESDITSRLDANGFFDAIESIHAAGDIDLYKETVPAASGGYPEFYIQTDGSSGAGKSYGLGALNVTAYDLTGGVYTQIGASSMTADTYTGGVAAFSAAVTPGETVVWQVHGVDTSAADDIGYYSMQIINEFSQPHGVQHKLLGTVLNGYPITGGGGSALDVFDAHDVAIADNNGGEGFFKPKHHHWHGD